MARDWVDKFAESIEGTFCLLCRTRLKESDTSCPGCGGIKVTETFLDDLISGAQELIAVLGIPEERDDGNKNSDS